MLCTRSCSPTKDRRCKQQYVCLPQHGLFCPPTVSDLMKVLIVIVSVACSVSVFTKLNATSVNSLMSGELARSMSKSTSSRAACSIASEWEDQRITTLCTGGS